MEKTCRKCGQVKALSEFYRHSGMADGYLNHCKACKIQQSIRRREDNLELVKAHDRKRNTLPHRIAARKAYQQTVAGKAAHLRASNACRKRNPKKTRAHEIVAYQLRLGNMVRKPCEICKDEELVHAHHDDYDKPLEVRWFCNQHHREWHEVNGEALNAAP